ncbi:MAG: DUF86 domain-containing protein [Methylococcaceae bacterium]|nr:DUF86 domain-containing protein [Methylococcaceae bacterium]
MSRDQQRLADYLAHILEAIDRYTGDMDEVVFLNNSLVQDAMIRNFEIIGEASNNIEKHYPEFAATHPEFALGVRLPDAQCRRSRLFKVDFEIVWKTIHRDLPVLHAQIQDVQASIPPSYPRS